MTMWLLCSVIITLCQKILRYAVSLIHCSRLTKHHVVLLYAVTSFHYYVSVFHFLRWNRYFVGSFFHDFMWTNLSMTCDL